MPLLQTFGECIVTKLLYLGQTCVSLETKIKTHLYDVTISIIIKESQSWHAFFLICYTRESHPVKDTFVDLICIFCKHCTTNIVNLNTGYERQVTDNIFLEVIYYIFCHRWLGFEDRSDFYQILQVVGLQLTSIGWNYVTVSVDLDFIPPCFCS